MSTALIQHAGPEDGTQLCFDLHDGKFGPWVVTHKGDQAVRKLLDSHYSRQSKGHSQFCRPGNNLILRNVDCTAVWISWRSLYRDDGQEDVWECASFRNSAASGYLSSEMIHWAIYTTICCWHDRYPAKGIITYVDSSKILSSNPGYRFKVAGFKEIGRSKRRNLILLHHPLENNYLALRAAKGIREIDYWVRTALDSGEFAQAYDFFRDGDEHYKFLHHLQQMVQHGRLTAWRGLEESVMKYEELMEIISPYEEIDI
ncbi:hypothetical protein SAMN04487897_109115 [Paenibacillus sp. yr247]|uniref:hypothetical protein n=1 Tax=Paenibacillus sp. yr247 TaxID=1761880 RepID=UPI000881A9E5|nr:hypothetical protein [Paenibacillus sp. yr247]SDO17825.1 hypothetical protein SAMN04487897_109115 [Paenibacillus sp. yr247]